MDTRRVRKKKRTAIHRYLFNLFISDNIVRLWKTDNHRHFIKKPKQICLQQMLTLLSYKEFQIVRPKNVDLAKMSITVHCSSSSSLMWLAPRALQVNIAAEIHIVLTLVLFQSHYISERCMMKPFQCRDH